MFGLQHPVHSTYEHMQRDLLVGGSLKDWEMVIAMFHWWSFQQTSEMVMKKISLLPLL